MAPVDNDILQEISIEEIQNLRDFYKNHLPYATYIYSFLNTSLKWMKFEPGKRFFKFFAPNGEWRDDGTFLVLLQWACNDLLVFTLDKKCERLYKSLIETNKIDWNKRVIYFALHEDHREAVLKAADYKNLSIVFENKMDLWWLPKDKAEILFVDCPEDYYIDILKPEHAEVIYDMWPYGYKESADYVATFIEMNGGHGVFSKSDNSLVSWVLKNHLGTLGALQTLDEHKRKGLGSIVTKSLSKEIAMDGHNPVGTILKDNLASQTMFKNIGYEILNACSFLGVLKKLGTDDLHVFNEK